MNWDKVIGIDPGNSGGIAVWSKRGPVHRCGISVTKMPTVTTVNKKGKRSNETCLEAVKMILNQQKQGCNPIVFIEKVQPWLSDEDSPGKAYQMTKLLGNYTSLTAILTLLEIPFIEVPPVTWQSKLMLRGKGLSKSERKNSYVEAVKHYYPGATATLWSADAILLVHFGRWQMKNDPEWIQDKLGTKNKQNEIF